jgi:hypothetical protein
MLNRTKFAHSITLTSAIFYLFFYFGSLITPGWSAIFLNANFFGADVAQFLPTTISFGALFQNLIVLGATAWIFGYLWATLYNALTRA